MVKRRKASPTEAGFNLIELVVTLALMSIILLLGWPALLGTLNRVRLTGTAREAAILLQLARMEAVKKSVQVEVVFQNAATCSLGVPCLFAFADLNADGNFTVANDRIVGGPLSFQPGIELYGPTDGAPEGANSLVGFDNVGPPNNDGPVFRSDGSVPSTGAFRFVDRHNNFLEVRIDFAGTGKVVIQKWVGPDVNVDWFENGEGGNAWVW